MTASDGDDVPGFAFVHDHNGDNGIEPFGFDRRNVVGDENLARGDVVALADVGREAFALQLDGVQTQVDQNADVIRGHDDVGVRKQLQDLAADRSNSVDHPARRVDCGAVSHHALGEHGVGDVLKRNRTPPDRGEDWRLAHCRDSFVRSVRTNNTSVPERRSQLHWFSSKLPLSFGGGRCLRQRRITGNERHDETSRGAQKVGSAHSRLRPIAAAGQEPHAADCGAAGGGNPAPIGPGRPAGQNSRLRSSGRSSKR